MFNLQKKKKTLKPKISIIIVHHKHSFYTEKALNSVLKQTNQENIECILTTSS